jgi:phosphatidate phosphatase APP1
MKLVFFAFSFLLSLNLYASSKPYLISGFDDVLRQAENTGLLKAAIKILEKDKTFTGMAELYSVISIQEPIPKFVLVSAISSWFDGRIGSFLTENQFPEHQRYLRNWLTEWSIQGFKVEKIKEIIHSKPTREFIVIFDNSDASLSLADILHSLFPMQIKAIYLRKVVEKETPASAIPFFTSFDIALNENATGRMSIEDVKTVGLAVLKEKNVDMLFPAYALCPVKYDPCSGVHLELQELCTLVRSNVQALCQLR